MGLQKLLLPIAIGVTLTAGFLAFSAEPADALCVGHRCVAIECNRDVCCDLTFDLLCGRIWCILEYGLGCV